MIAVPMLPEELDTGSEELTLAETFRQMLPPGAGVGVCRITRDDNDGLRPLERQSIVATAAQRRADFAAGRRAARTALTACNFAPADIPIRADRSPAWPDGVVGSISHSAHIAVAVCYSNAVIDAIGIDIEPSRNVTAELESMILVEVELAALRSLPSAERETAATTLFSLKESYYKFQASCTNRWLEFKDVSVRPGTLPGDFIIQEFSAPSFKPPLGAAIARARHAAGFIATVVYAPTTVRSPCSTLNRTVVQL